MILSQHELAMLKPMLALANHISNSNVSFCVDVPGMRHVTVEVSEGTVLVTLAPPDGAKAREYFLTPQGLALAYGLPLAKVVKVGD